MSGLPDPAARPLLGAEESLHALGDPMGRSAWYAALKSDDELARCVVSVGRRRLLSTARLRAWCGLDAHAKGATSNGADGAHSNGDGTVDRE